MPFLTLGGKRGMMTLQNDLTHTLSHGIASNEFELNVVFRQIDDDGPTYFVAECLEIPGCISEGDTQKEAEKNIEEAMQLCVAVMLEDCMKRAIATRRLPDLRGVSSQTRLNVSATPCLEFAAG
jgi:predicted RNase H-like HicB family nuclease